MNVWNLTLHRQGDREVKLAAREGFDLDPRPRGVFVEAGEAGFLEARRKAAETLRECRAAGAAALLGGHTAVWLAAALDVVAAGGTLPVLVFFEIERKRTPGDGFCFHPLGLRRIGGGSGGTWVGSEASV